MTDRLKRHPALLSAASLVLAVAVGIVLALFYKSGSATAGPKQLFVNGQLNYPQPVRARMDALNDRLDRCLVHNGAVRVLLGQGWTYHDPGLVATKACAREQDAVNAYANGAEVRRAEQALEPALRAYWRCIQDQGIARSYHVGQPVAPPSVLAAASAACGGPSGQAAGR